MPAHESTAAKPPSNCCWTAFSTCAGTRTAGSLQKMPTPSRAINALVAEEPPMLVDMRSTKTVTHGAREVFAVPDTANPITLVGSSAVDRMIANFFLGFNTPPLPMKYFTSRERAMLWLKKQSNENDHSSPG